MIVHTLRYFRSLFVALLILVLFAAAVTGCGDNIPPPTPDSGAEQVASVRQAFSASCTFGNPFTVVFPNRLSCTWQPTTSIMPIPPTTEFCVGPVPADRVDIFDAAFAPGVPPQAPYATANCARLVAFAGPYGNTYSYNFVEASGWLTPTRWIRSVNIGSHIQVFMFSKANCLNCAGSYGIGNGGLAFPIPDMQAAYGADMQIAVLGAIKQSP